MVPPQVTYASTVAQLKAISNSDRADSYTRLVVGPGNPPGWHAWYSYHSEYDNALLSSGIDIVPLVIIPDDDVGAWVLTDISIPPPDITPGFIGRWQAGNWLLDPQDKVQGLINLVQGGENLIQSNPSFYPSQDFLSPQPVVRFDGNQWFTTTTNLGLGGDPKFTFYIVLRQFSFWGYNPVFGWGSHNSILAACGLWAGNDDGKYSLEFYDASAVFDRVTTEWSIVAVSKKTGGISDTCRLFVNGQRQRMGETNFYAPFISNGPLELGRWAGNNISSFRGLFADLIIYPETHDDNTIKTNSLALSRIWKKLVEY